MGKVILIEGLQMVVVFISAEFIQMSAGICYHPLLAVLLCDLGVVFGASLIYGLVNLLKFDRHFFRSSRKIDDLAKKSKKPSGTQILMYILFVMPVIPFGAICYYGASQKLSYRRYIFTCATGVVPSILSSILMGKLLLFFTSSGLPVWQLALLILLIAAVLFVSALLIIRKFYFKNEERGSLMYSFLMKVMDFVVGGRKKAEYVRDLADQVPDGPFVLLSNHASFFDFYYTAKLMEGRKLAFLCNRYYFRVPILRFLFKRLGVIPKSLFTADAQSAVGIIRRLKNGGAVAVFPEGRLSADGTAYDILPSTAEFFKRLGYPIVTVRIEGAYLNNPKWRKSRYREPVRVSIVSVLSSEEIAARSEAELSDRIRRDISYNDFAFAKERGIVYPGEDKAEGIESMVCRCPVCRGLYTLRTAKNSVACADCGMTLTIGEDYSFEENPHGIRDIHDLYSRVQEIECEEVRKADFAIETEVHVIRKHPTDKKLDEEGDGVCRLTAEGFTFEGSTNGVDRSFFLPISAIPAMAFSANEEFECYNKNILYYFYPKENRAQCSRWAMLADALNLSPKP